MATINFRYDAEKKAALCEEAERLGYRNLSDYLVSLIDSRPGKKAEKPKHASKIKPVPVGVGASVQTRVTREEKGALSALCKEEGVSESFLLLRQVRILINNGPHFSKDELQALRNATNQLTAIGRNLNQILIKINSGQVKESPLTQKYIERIQGYIKSQSESIRSLVKKTRTRVVEQ